MTNNQFTWVPTGGASVPGGQAGAGGICLTSLEAEIGYRIPPPHINMLMAYIQRRVAEEREACARVAEDGDHVVDGRGYYDQLGDANATSRNIAKAIRDRGAS